MGPIEAELRGVAPFYHSIWQASDAAFEVCIDAAEQLGFSYLREAGAARALPDVLSEAIEAAEALSL